MTYPLLVHFIGLFKGQNFVAEVSAKGRLVASDDGEDGWWIYGVNPGALSADGPTLDEAHMHVRSALKEILQLFATETESFATFRDEVEKFFFTSNEATEFDWRQAVERVRANQETLGGLPVGSAACPVTVDVRQSTMPDVTPENSIVTIEASLAKAA